MPPRWSSEPGRFSADFAPPAPFSCIQQMETPPAAASPAPLRPPRSAELPPPRPFPAARTASAGAYAARPGPATHGPHRVFINVTKDSTRALRPSAAGNRR
jgi:hypothetical protein